MSVDLGMAASRINDGLTEKNRADSKLLMSIEAREDGFDRRIAPSRSFPVYRSKRFHW